MALQAEEDNTCGGCGQPRDESMAPGAEDTYRTRLIACHACAERAKAQVDLQESPAEHGLHITLERTSTDGGRTRP